MVARKLRYCKTWKSLLTSGWAGVGGTRGYPMEAEKVGPQGLKPFEYDAKVPHADAQMATCVRFVRYTIAWFAKNTDAVESEYDIGMHGKVDESEKDVQECARDLYRQIWRVEPPERAEDEAG